MKSNRVRNIAAIVAAMLLISWVPARAGRGQEHRNLPSVSLKPSDGPPTGPNEGGWFTFQLKPGEMGMGKARITNPADVPQHIKIYLADLAFSANGTPQVIDGEQRDIGSWGQFIKGEIVVPARATVDKEFEITVPAGAEPGDHIGVVVAESDPEPGEVRFVKRVATRIYVTVPGDAKRSMQLEGLTRRLNAWLLPRKVVASVRLRNTGRVRLEPAVTIARRKAAGSSALLSRSVETYTASVPVPWYGGWIKLPVLAQAEGVPDARLQTTQLVFPWLPLLILLNLILVMSLVRRWWKARSAELEALRTEVRRLESMVKAEAPGP